MVGHYVSLVFPKIYCFSDIARSYKLFTSQYIKYDDSLSLLYSFINSLHNDELRDILHLSLFFLPFIAYQYPIIILVLPHFFLNMLVMLIPMLITSEQDQVDISQCIC